MAQYRKSLLTVAAALLLPLVVLVAAPASKPKGYTGSLSARHPDAAQIAFIRPGIIGKIVSASVAADGTITTRVTITDPKGLPLDKDGIATAGPVSLAFTAA